MPRLAWVLLAFAGITMLPPLLLAGDAGVRAQFLGGTVAELPSKSEGRINLTDEQSLLLQAKNVNLRIPYRKISTLEYGQRVNRRYAEAILISPVLLLSKSRKHF